MERLPRKASMNSRNTICQHLQHPLSPTLCNVGNSSRIDNATTDVKEASLLFSQRLHRIDRSGT